MKIKIEQLKGSQKLIKVEVEAQRVEAALDRVYNSIGRSARIPGYRPGKAPRDLLKTHYDKKANEEVVNSLVWDCYREAIAEQSIKPVGYPVVSDVDFKGPGAPLNFSVKVDVDPEFKLKQYKGIKVQEKPFNVTLDDVEAAIKQLQESMAEYKNINPRPIKIGDYIVCLFECFENGKLVDKKDKLWLYINDKLQPKELLDELLDAEVGVEKQVLVNYPQDYQYKELAGKNRLYKVTPKELKEKALPAIDDELAKAAGNFSDLESLKKTVKDNLLSAKKLESERALENQIYESLLKSHQFEVPESLVDRQLERLVQEARQRLVQQGYKEDDLSNQTDKLKESLRGQAVKNVRLFFIIDKIAKQESVDASFDDIENKIKDISSHTKQDIKNIRQHFEDKQLLESLKEQIIHDRVVEFLRREVRVG